VKIVSSSITEKNPDSVNAGAQSQQLLRITEDFALAYRQRENVRHAYIAEKENTSRLSSSVLSVLRGDIMTGLLAAHETVSKFTRSNHQDPSRNVELQRANAGMTCAYLLVDALAYLVSIKGKQADTDSPEIHAVIKEVIKKTSTMLDWKGCDIGVGETVPGQRVYGSSEGFRHIIFATVSGVLAGNVGEGIYFFRTVKNDESVIVTMESISRIESEPGCARGGFRVAAEIARELGVIYEVDGLDSGYLCRMEFAGV
jgi:hypothetical protein